MFALGFVLLSKRAQALKIARTKTSWPERCKQGSSMPNSTHAPQKHPSFALLGIPSVLQAASFGRAKDNKATSTREMDP